MTLCMLFFKHLSIYTRMSAKQQDGGQVYTEGLIAVTSVGRDWGSRKGGTFLYPLFLHSLHAFMQLAELKSQRTTMERC